MITRQEILNQAREAGKEAALDLAARAPEMIGTEIIDEQDSVPAWNASTNYTQIGCPVQYNDQVYTLLQAHNSSYYAGQTPASLPALWSIKHTTNPAKAKAYMAPNGQSGMYMKNDCCTENGHVYQSAIDNNVWPPSGYPDGWTDLGTVEDVQGAI